MKQETHRSAPSGAVYGLVFIGAIDLAYSSEGNMQ
jgi:hypothetical protein